MANIYIEKTSRNDVPLINNTGADLAQFDFTVIAPYACIADSEIINGEVGNFNIEAELLIQATEFVTSEDTFATLQAPVYFDPTTKKFSDTSTAGYFLVGYVTSVKSGGGVMKFEKLRFATIVPVA